MCEGISIRHFWAWGVLPTSPHYDLSNSFFRCISVYISYVYWFWTGMNSFIPSIHENYAKFVEEPDNWPSFSKSLIFHSFFTKLYPPMRIFNANNMVLISLKTRKNWRRYSTNTQNEPKFIKIRHVWKKSARALSSANGCNTSVRAPVCLPTRRTITWTIEPYIDGPTPMCLCPSLVSFHWCIIRQDRECVQRFGHSRRAG